MKKNILFIFLFTFQFSFAQSNEWSISGSVTNAATKSPLQGASVFISNSSKGTSTDSLGNFSLKGLENGNYNLVISFMGFETQVYPVALNGKNAYVSIDMKDLAKQLEDVVISLKNGNRNDQLKVFRKAFLGTDKNAKQTEIVNEDKLRMHVDESGKILSAHSNEMLMVANNALGYHIKYLLKEFSYDKKTGDLHYVGYPLFEEMKSSSASQEKEWKENREKVYRFSLLRFYRTLGKRSLIQQGYILGNLITPQLDNPQARGVASKPIIPPNGFLITVNNLQYVDTLFYPEIPYYKLMTALPGHKYLLNFSGIMSVDATNSQGKPGNIDYYKPGEKTSIISLRQPVEINEDGLPQDPSMVTYTGYWMELRIADLLPFDYKPAEEINK
ncbi:MAG: carboxypeptidase-like regulatory domain-containing protein [Ginsengibacter sp.]